MINSGPVSPAIFQSTLSRGERQTQSGTTLTISIFQSTLSHGERLERIPYPVWQVRISIHSLAWRETYKKHKYKLASDISIHSLAWRETETFPQASLYNRISIHSLAWRETVLNVLQIPN